jgi:hypothetical protein
MKSEKFLKKNDFPRVCGLLSENRENRPNNQKMKKIDE